MSSFFEELAVRAAEKLEPKVGEQVQSWVEKVVVFINGKLVPSLDPRFQGLAAAGAQALDRGKAVIATRSAAVFTEVVNHLALGQKDEARTAWLRDQASFEDILDTMDRNSQVTQARIRREAEEWEAFRLVAQSFLEATGRAAIPILIGAAL